MRLLHLIKDKKGQDDNSPNIYVRGWHVKEGNPKNEGQIYRRPTSGLRIECWVLGQGGRAGGKG